MRAGRLVPDDLVLRILQERVTSPDTRDGFLLDGYPRTIAQAEALDRLTPIDAVVDLELTPARLVERLAGRRICPRCQSVYNLVTRPPRVPDRCDNDATELVQRPDDRPEAVATRLKVYAEQTAPLLEFYRRRGSLRSIDADGPPDVVTVRLRSAIASSAAAVSAATRKSSPPVQRSPSQ
jgi:adenylate kinase